MIEIRDLVFEYPGHRALAGVSLKIVKGSITALVGPNGAGKTTLLRCVAALETPYSGSVTIDGLDTREAPRAIHAGLGYLPDFFGLYDALTVRRCLHYAARAHGIAPGAAARAAQTAAARVGLSDRLEQAAGALSRGLRQRLAIAQSIVHQPKVLLLDEPAAGLDPQARRDLSQMLLSLRDSGMTLVVSSHILAELEDYSDRMVIVDRGHIAGGESIALKTGARLRIALAVPRQDLKDFLDGQGIQILEASADHAVVSMAADAGARAGLLAALVAAGFAVADFTEDARALEDVYFAQTGAKPWNPELQRNLWLEASPFRLALIAGLVLLAFAATSVAPPGIATPSRAASALYWFFAVLWGTRSAALSVVAEIRERTWDSQKLSSIGPWEMVWGKLFGATAANWFGALLCFPVILLPAVRDTGLTPALTYGVILLALGVFAQAVALLSSLVLIRRNTGNWRLDTFLCQVAGIAAALTYYSLWSSVSAFKRSGTSTLEWWGHGFNLGNFHLVSLLVFLCWALVGCWRAMRAELRFANGPYVWLAYLVFSAVYSAGFESWIGQRLPLETRGTGTKLALASLTLLASTYSMVFLEPKDPVRLRWLGEQVRDGRFYKAFLALDCWMLSYAATIVVGLVLAAVWAPSANGSLTVLAILGFLTRDVAIFVLMRGRAGGKGDFAALAILGALYLLLPTVLAGLGLHGLDFLFLPSSPLSVIAAWGEGAACAYLTLKRIAR